MIIEKCYKILNCPTLKLHNYYWVKIVLVQQPADRMALARVRLSPSKIPGTPPIFVAPPLENWPRSALGC